MAALYPAQTDFLYFVARNDGTHIFSRTLREHERAIDIVRKLNSRQTAEKAPERTPQRIPDRTPMSVNHAAPPSASAAKR
jgi:hypothetical protein